MKKILVTVSGPDQPGITSKLMDIVVTSGNSICDMGQAVTYNLLSLSFVIETKDDGQETLKELLFAANRDNLRLEYRELKEPSTPDQAPSRDKFILTCVAPKKLNAAFIRDLSSTLSQKSINIHRIDNLTPQIFHSLEMVTTPSPGADIAELKGELLEISTKHAVDIAFLKNSIFRRNMRLVAFDMDSTLIQGEVIDELATLAGRGEEVRKITEQAMNGEIDFEQALRKRVTTLAGLKMDQLEGLLDSIPLTPGCSEFILALKNLGHKTVLISGGFSLFAEQLKKRLGLDYAFANELEIQGGALTGKLLGEIVDPERKSALLAKVAKEEGICLEQTVAIGDGANDLPMLNSAGLGIAYHAKEAVRRRAPQHLGHGPLTSILYFLGVSPEDLREFPK